MYNTLYVPLDIGTWQCMLMPCRQYDTRNIDIRWAYRRRRDDIERFASPSTRSWAKSSWDEQREDEAINRRLLEEDRRAFDLYFRPNWDLRSITGGQALEAVQSFLGEFLNVAHWNLPTDNASVERALRLAVASGDLVPIVNRDQLTTVSAFRPTPAPLRWPPIGTSVSQVQPIYYGLKAPMASGGAGGGSSGAVAQAVGLDSSSDTAADDTGGGFDWLGLAETVAGTALGSGDGSGGDDDKGLDGDAFAADSGGDGGDVTTPLGNAQPFEYTPDLPDGDPFDIAKTPNTGEPGTWYTNPGSGQMRLFGQDGRPVVDLDFDHFHNGLKPHAHNWNGGARDGGDDVVPFSPWNP
ncbi:hypothetical protein WK73_24740 [Burkholderia ubonensis]|uniref:hypothetical protein n=1 Tax=Burkholderia ubonensis TaxID=101571 RepID=UPI0007552785|nr:hypothetical protein [Burkholderia ubonensis]KVU68285.1 hypothetical protein WK73_24740 [Burkholderia ubonensis]